MKGFESANPANGLWLTHLPAESGWLVSSLHQNCSYPARNGSANLTRFHPPPNFVWLFQSQGQCLKKSKSNSAQQTRSEFSTLSFGYHHHHHCYHLHPHPHYHPYHPHYHPHHPPPPPPPPLPSLPPPHHRYHPYLHHNHHPYQHQHHHSTTIYGRLLGMWQDLPYMALGLVSTFQGETEAQRG